MHELTQSSIAVLIDYENLALGLTNNKRKHSSNENHQLPDIKRVFERLVDKGRIVSKRAYCDWQRFGNAVTPLHELGIELIEIPDRAYTGKNSGDIRLTVDAVEMCFTREHIDTFAILSGDSDFSPLVAKLKELGKVVIGVGMKASTSALLADGCDEFIFYEDILTGASVPDFVAKVPADKVACYQLLLETIDSIQHEREGDILPSLLKITMKRKRPQFSESSYGYRNFTSLLKEAAQKGFIQIHEDPKTKLLVIDGFCE